MTERRSFVLHNPQQAWVLLRDELWPWIKAMTMAGHRLVLTVAPEKRSDAQNNLMWSALGDIARQVVWHGMKLDAADWKEMCTAALRQQRPVPGLSGGFVVLGASTRAMTKAEMTELIEFIHFTGAEHGVAWSPASIAQDLSDA